MSNASGLVALELFLFVKLIKFISISLLSVDSSSLSPRDIRLQFCSVQHLVLTQVAAEEGEKAMVLDTQGKLRQARDLLGCKECSWMRFALYHYVTQSTCIGVALTVSDVIEWDMHMIK